MKTKTTKTHLNPKAVAKATRAADYLAKAARLMREAAELSDGTIASGHGDFIEWATRIEDIISCDHGEAGIGPTMQRMVERADPQRPKVKTYAHRKSDGTTVRVTIPE